MLFWGDFLFKIRIMRLLFNVFLLGILFSCQEEQDPIIGDWKIEKDLINNETEDFVAFMACSRKTTYSFTKDSVYIFESYMMDETGNCQSLGKMTGFWKKKNDSVYLLRKNYVDTIRLRFLENNTKLILKNQYEEAIFQLKRIK